MRKKNLQFIRTKSRTFLKTNFEKLIQYSPNFLPLTLIILIDLPVNQSNKQLFYLKNYTHQIVWRLL